MELRHLRYFSALAKEMHFGRAAASLGMEQPPLSQQLKKLEEELGVQLISRANKRRIELTAAGKAFLGEADRTLAQADAAIRAARLAAKGLSGQLAIGFVSSSMSSPELLKALKTMRTERPGVLLALHELNTMEQIAALREGRLDIALLRPPESWEDDGTLKMKILRHDCLSLVLPKEHRLASRRKAKIAELAKEPFIMVPPDFTKGLYGDFMHLCAKKGFTPEIVQEAKSIHIIVSLVASGIGISVVPDSMHGFREDVVVYLDFEEPKPKSSIAIMWREEDDSPALKAFVDILLGTFGQSKGKTRQGVRTK